MLTFFFIDIIKLAVEAPSKDEIYDVGTEVALRFIYLGIAMGITGMLREIGFRVFYATQMAHVRHAYYGSVLRQEMGWHDRNNSTDVANRLLSHVVPISAAYDFDMSFMFVMTSMGSISVILSLVDDWQLTLASISVYPIVILAFYINLRLVNKGSEVSTKAFARAAQVASEDIGLIRTIWTFCTQMHESLR
jgi:ABC-type multidrug transport system fused ATPase/permease subunit